MIRLTERMLKAIIVLREAPAFGVFCSELEAMSEEMVMGFMSSVPEMSDVNAQKREDITRGISMTLYTLSKCFKNPEEALEHIRIIDKEVSDVAGLSSV